MTKNIDRLTHFARFSSPTPDDEGYHAFTEFFKKRFGNDIKARIKSKRNFREASSVVYTQLSNGTGLIQDKELRFFLFEFNSRTWNYGLGSLPASFNVLEGFFKWSPNLFFFELLEEEEHMFSFFDFIDFVTSKNCLNSLDYFIENVENDLIHTYNILNEVKDITFSTTDSKEYVIGGVSFVKRANEVFMLLIAGEVGDVKEISKNIPDFQDSDKTRSYLEAAEDRKKEAVKLFDRPDIWKVNLYVRIDLEQKTIDSRYIQKDIGIGFLTTTDDYEMLETAYDEKDQDTLEKVIKKEMKEIKKYEAIFEVAYHCLFLPEYFNFYNDQILPEEHPTGLSNKKLRSLIPTKTPNYSASHFFKTKDVWILDRNIDPASGAIKLQQTELQIEKDGYWHYLEPGKIGKDKNGSKIHGRTWVEKTLTWHESTTYPTDLQVSIPKTISQNKGFIYLLRNPAHELDLFKIGLTTKTVEKRAEQLSGTSSPDKFLIINKWSVSDCVLAEKLIHQKLNSYRLNPKREFFKISLEDAIQVILPIIKEINSNGDK